MSERMRPPENMELSYVVVNTEQHGKVITVATNSFVQVLLDEIPSSGYRWDIQKLDEDYLYLHGEGYLESPGQKDEIGGMKKKYYFLEAKTPGSTEIELKKNRPWEEDVTSDQVFTTKFIIS